MPSSRLLHAALFCPTPEGFWGLPLLCWSEPGTGKTAAIKAAARRTGLPCKRLSPAECGEGQFGVVPVPMNGVLTYPPPDWIHELRMSIGEDAFEPAGVIFIDEISTAVPAIQAPLLGLAQFRTIGSYTFGPRVRTIAAANETIDAAGGWDLAPALANRFGHLQFDGLDASAWVAGLLGGFRAESNGPVIDAAAEEARVMAAWPSSIAKARGLVGGFISCRPELLHKRPAQGQAASRAWPSRRTVEYATYALAAAEIHHLSEIETDELIAAFVSLAWTAEFRTWVSSADLPDPADVLDGKVAWRHDDRRVDRTYAVLGACAALLTPDPGQDVSQIERRLARAEACWKLIGSVAKSVADAAVSPARALIDAGLTTKTVSKSAHVLSDLLPFLTQAGF